MKKKKILLTVIAGELTTIALLISAAKSYSILASISPLLASAIPAIAIAITFMIVNSAIHSFYKKYSNKNRANERRLVSTIFTETQIFTILILLQAPAFALFGKLPVLLALTTSLLALNLNIRYPLQLQQAKPAHNHRGESPTTNGDKTPNRIYNNKKTDEKDKHDYNALKNQGMTDNNEGESPTKNRDNTPKPILNKTNLAEQDIVIPNPNPPPNPIIPNGNGYIRYLIGILAIIVSILAATRTAACYKSFARIIGFKPLKAGSNKQTTKPQSSNTTDSHPTNTTTKGHKITRSSKNNCSEHPIYQFLLNEHGKIPTNYSAPLYKPKIEICLAPVESYLLLSQPKSATVAGRTEGEKDSKPILNTDRPLGQNQHNYESAPSPGFITYTLCAFTVYLALASTQRPRPF